MMSLNELKQELKELEKGRDRVLEAYKVIGYKYHNPSKKGAVFLLILSLIALIICSVLLVSNLPDEIVYFEKEIRTNILYNSSVEHIEIREVSREAIDYLNYILDK
jgi:hypothetical protein